MIIINWSAFSGNPQLEQVRCILTALIVLVIVLNLVSFGGGGTDTQGHIGGALSGFLWAMAFFPRVKTPGAAKMRIVGLVGTAAFFIVFTVLLFSS